MATMTTLVSSQNVSRVNVFTIPDPSGEHTGAFVGRPPLHLLDEPQGISEEKFKPHSGVNFSQAVVSGYSLGRRGPCAGNET